MTALLFRTASQALQAFLPVAVTLAWLHRHRARSAAMAVRFALLAAVLLSPVAGNLFRLTALQSQWEAVLAALTVVVALLASMAARRVSRRQLAVAEPAPGSGMMVVLAAGTMLVVIRQTMEIAVVLRVAAFEVRSLDATLAIIAGSLLGIAVAAACGWAARAAGADAAATGSMVFGVLFIAQAALYGFHESAESRWLPWSNELHAATEPYGPDGAYGPFGSLLIAGLPFIAGIARQAVARRRPLPAVPRWLVAPAVVATLLVAGAVVFLARSDGKDGRSAAADASGGPSIPAGTPVATPGHVLFRRTNIESGYGLVTVASLEAPGASVGSAPLACERVAFGGGRGICLQADRGVFTAYRAVLVDQALRPLRSLAIAGSPSRTRISPDGRIGAITVFSTAAHSYADTTFSTTTTLVDMSSGDPIGDLEEFSTWRDGGRIKAPDFNFWGVTFARDPNMFYATLRTGGKTYLVSGDLALRKLTVLRENVECPSLSPDNRRLAFKKRVGSPREPWRLYVLELASMTDYALPTENRSIDDQVEWLDDGHVLYAVPRPASAVSDVWVAAVDGETPARVFLAEAQSPAVIR